MTPFDITNDTICYHEGQKYYYFQFVTQNFKNLTYAFWALFEQTQIETQWNKNYLILFWSFGKEYWLRTRKVQPKINIKYFFRDIWSVNNPIQTAAFFEILILYYTGPNFLTLKVATYLKRKLYFFLQHFLQVCQKCIQNPVGHLRWSFLRK